MAPAHEPIDRQLARDPTEVDPSLTARMGGRTVELGSAEG